MDQNLFNLIKNHQYDKLISLIKNNENLDLNIIDETGTYLLQYVILFRQKDLLALMITRNCKLDILDSDGRSIFLYKFILSSLIFTSFSESEEI